MSRHKTTTLAASGEYIPAEAPTSFETEFANAYVEALRGDGGVQAFFEKIKRTDHKTFVSLMPHVAEILRRVQRATPGAVPSLRVISPISKRADADA